MGNSSETKRWTLLPPPSEEKRRKRSARRFETFRIPGLRVPDVDPTGGVADPEERELELSAPVTEPLSHVSRREPLPAEEAAGDRAGSEAPTIPAPPNALSTEYSITERAPPPWRVCSEEGSDTLTPEEWIDEDPADV